MQEVLNSLQGKKGIFLVLCIFGVAFLFGNFFPSAVTVSLMMTFVATLGNENAISSDRLVRSHCWYRRHVYGVYFPWEAHW